MRNLLALAFVLGLAAPALAQNNSGPVCREVYLGPVIVKTSGHQTLRGTLQCLTETDVLLVTEAGLKREPLANVKNIATPRDPVIDGILKGAVIGLLAPFLTLGESCGLDTFTSCTVGSMFELAALGGVIDALDGHSYVIYPRTAPTPAFHLHFRF